MVKNIDRRNKALGGQNNTRSKSAIKEIAWHYSATTNSSIENHERYWRNNRGWTYGGYHFYIDRDGNVYQNYNLETISNGVANHNSKIVNICCEASREDNYTQAQIDARHELTLQLMDELNLTADKVKQHGEFSGASTSCAGYTKKQMDAFRSQLANGRASTPKPVKNPAEVAKKPSNSTYTGGSIVEYLNSIKMDSSPASRKRFASQFGIKNYTGTAKQNTDLLNAMRDGVIPESKPVAKPKAASTLPTGIYKLQSPMRNGADVRNIQEALAKKHFYPDKGAKNNGIDGWYGAKTADAVRRFQSMNGLKADGIYGPATRTKLMQ